ncbi:uncharacterized protein K452DRAFT_305517 [Aplosporella prunicola CBS 121167]|uniref:Kinesin motor domain-containing protein n=1 Tax=Aplosporella prunicola CBS 121167 TaxID=1176127 RepID=A0A6A6BN11_9PEZI|nr:uncharacterized protein K452DRAFT_305517 [Aplosporella prunicola CBS 121167]KAF2145510.1 hypothetical protein K452DRAFT_305517 [Aplosporella prunicola CBS 121167]
MASPPGSPAASGIQRPVSAMYRSNRSSSRMSMSSRPGGSRASDEDSKTAVKVAVRVRPPLKANDPSYELIPQRFRGTTCQVTTQTNLTVESAQGKKLFVFDRVFGEEVDQAGIWEYLSDSVNSFVQGYNVSILAYGQSGAGKSYTMGTSGPKQQSDAQTMGVVSRAAQALFEQLTGSSKPQAPAGSGLRAPTRYSTVGLPQSKPADKNWQLKATYVEIYNEQLRDLLVSGDIPPGERAPVTIREDTKGRIILTGLQQVNINSIDDLLNALAFGSSIRQTDSTAQNAQSSRSHAVFSLNLVQKKTKTGPTPGAEKRRSVPLEAMTGESWVTVDSKLHFVDLAGSERLKNTGAEGARAREGISINAGLASLGKVISQLSSRNSGAHVSYRDSKLTRLLQDSLGGNAITYMIACVNPAEFHLSETLNTVQYAQRARAIQSKPQVQQSAEEGDKQAIIDRLRAEVQFLRDQIRLSERTDRTKKAPQEKAERQQEREAELQNQLLDLQENYSALSQRHANFISEFTKARDADADTSDELHHALGDSAMERLKRSNSFADAVQQVVMEYEKTIQSLEASLSTTRSSLSQNESTLLEKETKIAYMESVNQQLQARVQKATDREANSETYVRELEARVDGITTGEEKQSSVIQELRKELNRARENEASCEEYISTLEERLAEAEQDHELMQREIERLEHVIERQRSIGKLDNLLYELDNISKEEKKSEPDTNGLSKEEEDVLQGSDAKVNGQKQPDAESDEKRSVPETDAGAEVVESSGNKILQTTINLPPPKPEDMPQSPEQSRFVADKLDTVTQELFDLRMEHETTVHDFDDLQRKYQVALNTLSELQDAVDEARHAKRASPSSSSRPDSFLADAGVNVIGEIKEDGQPSSSRTLSSELSLLGESANTRDSFATSTEASDAETALKEPEVAQAQDAQHEETLAREMDKLKRLHEEKEEELMQRYAQLQKDHQDTLAYVEELKTDAQKAVSPSTPHIIRRKSSQNMLNVDRANRSFTALRNIALDHFEDYPDTIQGFEVNLNTIMTELHSRTERVAALEADMAQVRKEMEGKMTIISGLTRERSSLKSSPLDISVVSQMRDQLMESETQIKQLQESHANRERELIEQIDSLRIALGAPPSPSLRVGESADHEQMPGEFPETPTPGLGASKELGNDLAPGDGNQPQISVLQKEVAHWQAKHESTMSVMRASEHQLQSTIKDLEMSLRSAEALQAERTAFSDEPNAEIEELRREIDEHKATAAANNARLSELEHMHANILRQVEEDSKARELTERELQTHRDLVSNLERQLEEHKAAVTMHQQGLETLRETHEEEIGRANELLAAHVEEHKLSTAALQDELARARSEQHGGAAAIQAELDKSRGEMVSLIQGISAALQEDTDASRVQSQIETLVNERRGLLEKYNAASAELAATKEELQQAKHAAADLEGKVGELKMINEETLMEIERISDKEKKSSRLVEELEDQLNSNYDQHQAANNRLSALQTERQVQLEEALQARSEAERELQESRSKVADLETQLNGTRRASHRESLDPRDADLRKSSSHTTLPSPPPAIPLPPLPGSPLASTSGPPPSSPPASRQSKDIAQSQLAEDQEARIRTIEKHLFAEKQLTATLEEALTDLEASSTKVKNEMDGWKKKCNALEQELEAMKQERAAQRYSLQQVEEERNARMRVEAERAHLEARMAALNQSSKKKKKSALCF